MIRRQVNAVGYTRPDVGRYKSKEAVLGERMSREASGRGESQFACFELVGAQVLLSPVLARFCTMAEPPLDQQYATAPLSAKALGKRPALDSLAAAPSSSNGKAAANSPVAKAKEREKRVTRSSLGGAGSSGGPLSREGSAAASEGELFRPRLVCHACCSSSKRLLIPSYTPTQP